MTNLQTIVPQTAGPNWLSSLLLLLILPFFSTGSLQAQDDYYKTQGLSYRATYVLTAKHSNKSIDVPGSGDGQVIQYSTHSGKNQQFKVTGKGDGYYQLRSVSSGKLLEAKDGKVIVSNAGSGAGTLFKLVDKSNGYCSIIAKAGGKAFDVPGASKGNSAKIGLWGASGLDHQLFKFQEVPVTAAELMYVDIAERGKVIGSFVEMGDKKWSEFKLSQPGKSFANWAETGRGKFSVFLEDRGRGYKVALNLHTKKVVLNGNNLYDIVNPKANQWLPYNPVLQGPGISSVDIFFSPQDFSGLSARFDGTDKYPTNYDVVVADKTAGGHADVKIMHVLELRPNDWKLYPQNNGYYLIGRSYGGNVKYLSVDGSRTADGTNIKLNNKLNSRNQEFRFERNVQGFVRVVSHLGANLYLGRADQAVNNTANLVLRAGDKGYRTTFKMDERKATKAPGGPMALFAEQYAAPVANRVIPAAELAKIQFVQFSGGSVRKIMGKNEWLRYDNAGKVVDVLEETSRGNSKINLETYNQFIYDFTLSGLATNAENFGNMELDLSMKKAHLLQAHTTRTFTVLSVADRGLGLGEMGVATDWNKLRVVTFNGVVTMAYLSKKLMGGSDGVCSGGADHHKTLFDAACKTHDINYNAPWKEAGYGKGTAHSISDALFLQGLKAIVDGSNNPIDHTAAGFFYRSVRGTQQGENSSNSGYDGAQNYNKVIYKPDEKMRKALTDVIDDEYSTDVFDHIFRAGEWVKDSGKAVGGFFSDDVADWFSDNF